MAKAATRSNGATRGKAGRSNRATASSSVSGGDGDEITVAITPPNLQKAAFKIRGKTPLVMHRFSQKAREQIRETQESGERTRSGKKREKKDFNALYEGAMHRSEDGWIGIPCQAFRSGLVSACTLVGLFKTVGKKTVFIEADGYDVHDGMPLVRITKGEPQPTIIPARNASGVVDLRSRPMWKPGWEATVRVEYDADRFQREDVANLMLRLGLQVGILEGRPDSPKSCGMGWGLFEIVND